MNKYKPAIRHIIHNKQIILAALVLGLAAIFVFTLNSTAVKAKPAHKINAADNLLINSEDLRLEMENQETISSAENELPSAETIGQPRNTPCPIEITADSKVKTSTDEILNNELRIPVLMYHHIANPETSTMPHLFHRPKFFESQLKSLENACFQTIFVSDVGLAIKEGRDLPKKTIAITFDDGYDDMYTNAFRLLKKYNMKGTMYIIVSALDKPGYLTTAQVREMADSGHVEIAAHTCDHVNLIKTPDKKAEFEIVECKKMLEKISGKPVEDFAYPFGFFTYRDELLCNQAGYLTCASTYSGQIQTYNKRYSLYRLRPGYRVGPALINWLNLIGPKT